MRSWPAGFCMATRRYVTFPVGEKHLHRITLLVVGPQRAVATTLTLITATCVTRTGTVTRGGLAIFTEGLAPIQDGVQTQAVL